MQMFTENIVSLIFMHDRFHFFPEPSQLEMMVVEVVVDAYIYQSMIINLYWVNDPVVLCSLHFPYTAPRRCLEKMGRGSLALVCSSWLALAYQN